MSTPGTVAPTVVLVHGAFADAAHVAGALAQVPGPVPAAGHSCGRAVRTNAAARTGNVVGLVHVAASAPDEGELLRDIEDGSTDRVLNTAPVERQYPTGQGAETVGGFPIDLPGEQAALMAATQRPVPVVGLVEPNGPPARRTLPSWAVVATGDHAAGTDVVLQALDNLGRNAADRSSADD
jgi:hypothetical protein